MDPSIDIASLSLPNFNNTLKDRFVTKGWDSQSSVFDEPGDSSAKMDFLKERPGIDVGVYLVTTRNFQKHMKRNYNQNWEGSLTFQKVARYLPHFKSAIEIPIYVLGIDL